jgi:hypothetical protein
VTLRAPSWSKSLLNRHKAPKKTSTELLSWPQIREANNNFLPPKPYPFMPILLCLPEFPTINLCINQKKKFQQWLNTNYYNTFQTQCWMLKIRIRFIERVPGFTWKVTLMREIIKYHAVFSQPGSAKVNKGIQEFTTEEKMYADDWTITSVKIIVQRTHKYDRHCEGKVNAFDYLVSPQALC